MGRLDNQVVLITGAGSGLGRDTAKLFAKEGAKLAICGRRLERIKATEGELETASSNILTHRADVSNEEDVKRLVFETYSKFGRIDILINNAAVYQSYHIADTPLESWRYQMDNNVTSVFLMTKEVLPIMKSQKFGMIINITSSLAKTGAAGFGPYSASKAALEVLTASIDEEESNNGIAAMTFNPGVMKSELQSSGVDPAEVAPYLVTLCNGGNLFAGKHVDIEYIRKKSLV